jgi:hypothetical protein
MADRQPTLIPPGYRSHSFSTQREEAVAQLAHGTHLPENKHLAGVLPGRTFQLYLAKWPNGTRFNVSFSYGNQNPQDPGTSDAAGSGGLAADPVPEPATFGLTLACDSFDQGQLSWLLA